MALPLSEYSGLSAPLERSFDSVVLDAALSNDGEEVLVLNEPQSLVRWNLHQNSDQQKIEVSLGASTCSLTPDRSKMIVNGTTGIQVARVETGHAPFDKGHWKPLHAALNSALGKVHISADAEFAMFLDDKGDFWKVDLLGDEPPQHCSALPRLELSRR